MAEQFKLLWYDWNGANVSLFHLINGINGPIHDSLMLCGTIISSNRNFAGYMAMIALCALWQIHRSAQSSCGIVEKMSLRWIGTVGVFCVAFVIDSVIVLWIKTILAFPRPPLALPLNSMRILGNAEYTLSFPSGHASFAAVLVVSLWTRLNWGWRVCGIIFLLWVALSRISVGAHFPVDVVGGYVIAIPIVIAVRLAVDWYLTAATNLAKERV